MKTKSKIQKPERRRHPTPKQKSPVISKIVKRLIESDKECDEFDFAAGQKEGERWAADEAEIGEFENLEKYAATGGLNVLLRCQSPHKEMIEVLRPEDERRPGDGFPHCFLDDIWGGFENDVILNARFFHGFAERALEIWRDLKPHLGELALPNRLRKQPAGIKDDDGE